MTKKYKLMLRDGYGDSVHVATFYELKRILQFMYDNTLTGYQSYAIIILNETRDTLSKDELISRITTNKEHYTSTEYNTAENLRVDT